MSLFEKLKNKRSSLQEKKDDGIKKPTKKANKEVFDVTGKSAARDAKKYSSGEYPKIGGGPRIGSKSKGPGAETGAKVNLNPTSGSKSKGTTPVKVNITKPIKQSEVSKQAKEFSQNLKKIKGTKTGKPISTGDIGFTAPDRKTKVAKRTTRAIKQGTPDPFTVDTSKAAKQTAKDFGGTPKKSDFKKLSKRPGGYRAPAGIFGKGLTPGEFRVKQMDKSSFPITPYKEYDPIKQPRGVKIPGKTYKDFSKKLKKDVAKTSSSTPRTVTKKYKPTTTVKQSEVSKKAKDFTKKVNQVRAKKVTTTKTPSVFKRVTAATSGKKVTNSKGIGNQFRGPENKAAKDARINLDRASSGMGGGKPPKPPGKGGTLGFLEPDDTPKPKRVVTKQTRALQSIQQKFAKSAIGKGMRTNVPTLYKVAKNPIVRTAVKKGGLPTTIGLGLLASPTVRRGVKAALAGGTLAAFAGNKDKKAVLGPKTSGTPKKFNLSPDAKSNPNKSKYTAGVYGRPKAYS